MQEDQNMFSRHQTAKFQLHHKLLKMRFRKHRRAYSYNCCDMAYRSKGQALHRHNYMRRLLEHRYYRLADEQNCGLLKSQQDNDRLYLHKFNKFSSENIFLGNSHHHSHELNLTAPLWSAKLQIKTCNELEKKNAHVHEELKTQFKKELLHGNSQLLYGHDQLFYGHGQLLGLRGNEQLLDGHNQLLDEQNGYSNLFAQFNDCSQSSQYYGTQQINNAANYSDVNNESFFMNYNVECVQNDCDKYRDCNNQMSLLINEKTCEQKKLAVLHDVRQSKRYYRGSFRGRSHKINTTNNHKNLKATYFTRSRLVHYVGFPKVDVPQRINKICLQQ